MTIGERICHYREAKDLTQQQLADLIGTTPQNIYKYEKGVVTNIPLTNIQRMATIFGVTPSVLAGWDVMPESIESELSPAKKELMNYIKDLHDEDIERILKIAHVAVDK